MTGKTIEVINTDAEGRLILADAIAYAKKLGATKIIDMATLTGAVSIALGDVNAAVLGTDQPLIDEIISAGHEVGEKFWQLPLDKEYSKQIKSDIADIKNVGGRKAGTITAAAFLKEFAVTKPNRVPRFFAFASITSAFTLRRKFTVSKFLIRSKN